MNGEPNVEYFHMGQWPLYIGFTMSQKAFKKEMKRLNVDKPAKFLASDNANATTHYLKSDGVLTCIITMHDPKSRPVEQVASMIAHEAVHVAQELWEQIGEDNPGREAEAYLVQYITQCCLQVALDTGRERKSAP